MSEWEAVMLENHEWNQIIKLAEKEAVILLRNYDTEEAQDMINIATSIENRRQPADSTTWHNGTNENNNKTG